MRNGSLKILWDLFEAKRELSETTLLSCYVQTTMELLRPNKKQNRFISYKTHFLFFPYHDIVFSFKLK